MKLLTIAALAALFAFPAFAQQTRNCAPRDVVKQRLAEGRVQENADPIERAA